MATPLAPMSFSDDQQPALSDTSSSPGIPVSERRSARHVANRAFMAIKAQRAADRTPVEDAAERLNEFAASTPFLVLHVVWFVAWVTWNVGGLRRLGIEPFDPFPFGLLTMVVSLEAIFLSIFVLLAQKRESAIAELREELGLQVALWTEQEVTKTLQLVTGLYRRLGHPVAEDAELRQMLGPLDVHSIEARLMAEIERTSKTRASKGGPSIEKGMPSKATVPESSGGASSPPGPTT